jgi:predicted DCC family thiol-disulfide oxidoreductase YuxK
MITLYYDEDCSFCFKSVSRVLEGARVKIEVSTIQSISPENHFFSDLSASELYSAMWLIDQESRLRKKGYYAFKYIYSYAHKSRFLKMLFSIPFVSDYLGARVYEIVARNRRLAGCDSQSCSIHRRSDLE